MPGRPLAAAKLLIEAQNAIFAASHNNAIPVSTSSTCRGLPAASTRAIVEPATAQTQCQGNAIDT